MGGKNKDLVEKLGSLALDDPEVIPTFNRERELFFYTYFPDMHCDYFISGTHKWMFGPRGTGIICARSEELKDVTPSVPTFSEDNNFATSMTPGGYHAFEHRWALDEAFKLHLQLGKAHVQARIHALNTGKD